MFRAHVEFVIAHPGVPRFIFHELQQPADSAAKSEVRAVLQGYRKLLLGHLNRSIQNASWSAPNWTPRPLPRAFIGLIQGLVMQSMLLYRRSLGEAS
jgi:TetR/AcrR family transcriptional regulator